MKFGKMGYPRIILTYFYIDKDLAKQFYPVNELLNKKDVIDKAPSSYSITKRDLTRQELPKLSLRSPNGMFFHNYRNLCCDILPWPLIELERLSYRPHKQTATLFELADSFLVPNFRKESATVARLLPPTKSVVNFVCRSRWTYLMPYIIIRKSPRP